MTFADLKAQRNNGSRSKHYQRIARLEHDLLARMRHSGCAHTDQQERP